MVMNQVMLQCTVVKKRSFPKHFCRLGEDDFRNLTAKDGPNLDNPIKRYDFSKVSLMLCMSPSQVALF